MNTLRPFLVLSLAWGSIACGNDGSTTGTATATGSETSTASSDPDTTVTVSASMSDTQVDSSTTDPTDPTTGTATDPTTATDPSTTTDATTTDPGTGSSDGSTTDPTDASSTTDPSTSSSDSGGMALEGYGDCVNNPVEEACIDGEICLVNPKSGEGFCSLQGCVDGSDCPEASSGNATVGCIDGDGDRVTDCFLGCSMGESCPDGMVCFAQFVCVWEP